MISTESITGPRQRSSLGDVAKFPLPSSSGLEDRRAGARGASRMLTWLPLFLALAWLLGTFGVFWLTSLSGLVADPFQLCVFVVSATALFAAGYAARIWWRPSEPSAVGRSPISLRRVRRLVVASAVYYVVLSLTRLVEFGASGPRSVWENIQTPVAGYLNKSAVYAEVGEASLWMRALFVFGVLSTALVPLLVVYWRDLSGWLRLSGVAGIGMHIAFYLYIGTNKGLGDVVIMLAAGMLTAVAAGRLRRQQVRSRRRAALVLVAVVGVLFVSYMGYSHSSRSSEHGATNFATNALPPANGTVERLVGPGLAQEINTLIFYPTHGYLGLSYNLRMPFEWSRGLGNSPTVAGMAESAVGVDPSNYPSYPVRTESEQGWPAGQYWATIYPWLASDLTFPGSALLMGLIGWIFAHSWRVAVVSRRVLPTLIFAQLCIFLAYVPANNQLGMTPESAVGVATLLAIGAARAVSRPPGPTAVDYAAPVRVSAPGPGRPT
ncbi:hypothetical protein AB0J27_03945 [Micromonospora chokoriensis]